MASTADEPEQPLDPAGQTPSVDPSITPSTPRRRKPGVSAVQTGRKGGRRSADIPHVDGARRPTHRKNSTGPRRRELLQALGIFQRATPDQEVDRRSEDAHDLVTKLRRYWEWGRLLPRDADKRTVDLVRSRPDAIERVGHEQGLWRQVYPPTGREGLAPVAFVFADTTGAKVANTVAVLEEAGRGYWAPRRYDSLYEKAITALDYRQAVPVVVTTLEQLQEHGAGAAVWRRLGRSTEQTLTDALDNPDGHTLYRVQEARADAEDQRRRAAEREAQRPVCTRCGRKFSDERWEEITVHRTAVRAGDRTVCGPCRADDVARQEAAATTARLAAAAPPEPQDGPEAKRGRSWLRRRP